MFHSNSGIIPVVSMQDCLERILKKPDWLQSFFTTLHKLHKLSETQNACIAASWWIVSLLCHALGVA